MDYDGHMSFARIANWVRWRLSDMLRRITNLKVHDAREPNRVWEVYTLRKLFANASIDCVFDVGANAGQYATMLRRDVGFRGLIVSFEPTPTLARRLRRLARRDPLWIVEEVALSDTDGTATFNVMVDDQFSSLHAPSAQHVQGFETLNSVSDSLTVKTERLDTAYARLFGSHNFQRPFLKMDTQGHDTTIARASPAAVGKFIGLQSELSFLPLYAGSERFDVALDLYERYGLVLSALMPNNAGHFPDLVECDCVMVRPDSLAIRSNRPGIAPVIVS